MKHANKQVLNMSMGQIITKKRYKYEEKKSQTVQLICRRSARFSVQSGLSLTYSLKTQKRTENYSNMSHRLHIYQKSYFTFPFLNIHNRESQTLWKGTLYCNKVYLLIMVGNRGVNFLQKLGAAWFPKNYLRTNSHTINEKIITFNYQHIANYQSSAM